MKKVFDQTVRDIKREVNKKVLKVPGIEQKVLDSTSNEPWGPHGTVLAEIAQASRNYHEYQMIMGVIWKRINDTGKNWRHVYKALTVLDYLIAHGSERVIDEIREHAYQISTLSDFQYIDSSGRDQGNNVRRKSQSLVMLVNDKERIAEVRQKAAANRDKFRSMSSSGGMYRPNSYSSAGGYGDRYDDDRYEGRYGSRDEYGYGRERDSGYRDDDRYSRNGDSYSRDGDRYSRDYEERYGRDGYRDDDYRGRSRSVDDHQYGSSRSRSHDRDRDRDHTADDDGQNSSRGSVGRADDHSQDGRRLDRKFSEQNLGAPPSYEEAVGESQSPVHGDRDGDTSATSAPKPSSPPVTENMSPPAPAPVSSTSPVKPEFETFDEFDPRGTPSAATATSKSVEMDLLGSLSDSFSSNSLAIMPVSSATSASGADGPDTTSFGPSFGAAAPPSTNVTNQSFEDPFGDSPFKAVTSSDSTPIQPQTASTTATLQPNTSQNAEMPQMGSSTGETAAYYGFGDSLSGLTYTSANIQNSQFFSEPSSETDILADILPPSGPSAVAAQQTAFPDPSVQPAQPNSNIYGDFGSHAGPASPVPSQIPLQMQAGTASQFNYGNFQQQAGTSPPQFQSGPPMQLNNGNGYSQAGNAATPPAHMASQSIPPAHMTNGSFLPSGGGVSAFTSHMGPPALTGSQQASHGAAVQSDVLSNSLPQMGQNSHPTLQPVSSSTGGLAIVPQPSKDKFETKSTVWADTLSRGLVNLNISGPKTNPLADIGVDFDAINRREKRMEKQSTTPAISTVNMGKAMGSGSGMGRAGAGAMRPPPNPMAGSGMGAGMGGPGMGMGMGMGMGGGRGPGMGVGGYGGMNQSMGMGLGLNMVPTGYNMGGGMNMGVGQGAPMQQSTGLPPGSTISGGYNPMMGGSGYSQQPYGGYR